MKQQLKPAAKPMEMNRLFVEAFKWLRYNAGVKNADELATLLQTSPTTISAITNYKMRMSEVYAYRMNALLKKYGWALEDFDKPYINKQAALADKLTPEQRDALLFTTALKLEAGMEAVLDKLSSIETKLGELQKSSKTKRTKKSDQ